MSQSPNNANTPTRKLGRGLSSLIGNPVAVPPPSASSAPIEMVGQDQTIPEQQVAQSQADGVDGRRLVNLSVDVIVPSPFQPRQEFDELAMTDLANSIRSAGVMQPLVVRPLIARGTFPPMPPAPGDPAPAPQIPTRWELIAGERRWRAARKAGLTHVPAVIVEISDQRAATWALIENVQRRDLNIVEKARAYRTLQDRFHLTQIEIAEQVGEERSVIANSLRLLELEPPVLAMLERDELSQGHGKVLLSVEKSADRVALAKRCVEGSWSVRELEKQIEMDKLNAAQHAAASTAAAGGFSASGIGEELTALNRMLGDAERQSATIEGRANVGDLETQLSRQLGTKVKIKARGRKGAKGRIEVEYYSLDHFDALLSKLGLKVEG